MKVLKYSQQFELKTKTRFKFPPSTEDHSQIFNIKLRDTIHRCIYLLSCIFFWSTHLAKKFGVSNVFHTNAINILAKPNK